MAERSRKNLKFLPLERFVASVQALACGESFKHPSSQRIFRPRLGRRRRGDGDELTRLDQVLHHFLPFALREPLGPAT
jgi:hypothetical protein